MEWISTTDKPAPYAPIWTMTYVAIIPQSTKPLILPLASCFTSHDKGPYVFPTQHT